MHIPISDFSQTNAGDELVWLCKGKISRAVVDEIVMRTDSKGQVVRDKIACGPGEIFIDEHERQFFDAQTGMNVNGYDSGILLNHRWQNYGSAQPSSVLKQIKAVLNLPIPNEVRRAIEAALEAPVLHAGHRTDWD